MTLKQWIAGAAAIATTGVEVYCVFDGLKNVGGATMIAGIGIAILGTLIGFFSYGRRRVMGTFAFILVLACIVASGSRVGGANDGSQGEREQSSRASKVATDTVGELKTLLDDARTLAKKACTDGKERTSGRTKANRRFHELATKWTAAGVVAGEGGVVAGEGGVVAGEGDVARVSAWLGGYVTDRQVSLYPPLLWPATMALMGVFFLGTCGDSRSPRSASVPAPDIPKAEIVAPARPQLVSDHPPAHSVAGYVADVATKGGRLAFPDVYRDYQSIARYRGLPILETEHWRASLAKLCEGTPAYTRELGGPIYVINVRFIRAKRLGSNGATRGPNHD